MDQTCEPVCTKGMEPGLMDILYTIEYMSLDISNRACVLYLGFNVKTTSSAQNFPVFIIPISNMEGLWLLHLMALDYSSCCEIIEGSQGSQGILTVNKVNSSKGN